jgi:two-component system, NtrC family, response regulator HydG
MSRPVLVVDDDRHMVKTLCDLLRRRGWTPRGVHSGEEAIAAAGEQRFAAILMDVRMTGMNGVEAFRRIRASQRAVPVILMTAYSTQELLAEAERLGALRIFAKPLPLGELLTLLEAAGDGNEGVLLVDDDANFLRTLSNILTEHGHRPLAAGSLVEALALLERDDPAVVVLDLRLDDVLPRDAVLAIRRVSPLAALVLCSGYPALMEDTLAAFPAEWFRAVLPKPFDPERLLAVLEQITPRA